MLSEKNLEIFESFVNGNISWTKEKIKAMKKKQLALFMAEIYFDAVECIAYNDTTMYKGIVSLIQSIYTNSYLRS